MDGFVAHQLDEFTKGKLGERYSSIDPSGRGKLAGFDLEIFVDNPLIGVGPGMGEDLRRDMGPGKAEMAEQRVETCPQRFMRFLRRLGHLATHIK